MEIPWGHYSLDGHGHHEHGEVPAYATGVVHVHVHVHEHANEGNEVYPSGCNISIVAADDLGHLRVHSHGREDEGLH